MWLEKSTLFTLILIMKLISAQQTRWHRHRDRDSTRFINDRLHDSRLRRIHTTRNVRRFSVNQVTNSDLIVNQKRLNQDLMLGQPSTVNNYLLEPNFSDSSLKSPNQVSIGSEKDVHVGTKNMEPLVKFSSKKSQFWEKPLAVAANSVTNGSSVDGFPGENSKWRATYLDPDGNSPYVRFQSLGNLSSPVDSHQVAPKLENIADGKYAMASNDLENGLVDNLSDLTAEEMEARFLNIFTVVRFNNTACNGSAGDNGTCYTANECAKLGGVSSGNCASGFGVCCVFFKTCGQNTTANCTYFVNSNYPSTNSQTGSCQLVVNKCSSDVCQLRLDFITFVLGTPDANGVCTNDVFTVTTAAGSTSPSVCGTNSGQSLYIDIPPSQLSAALLTVVTSGDTNTNRAWKVKITQIPCNSLARAPSGCNQYYTGTTGQITTYNYNGGRGSQLANQDVTYCVRMDDGFCGIQYTVCPDTVNTVASAFSLTGLSTAKNSRTAQNCLTDWVTIPCASDTPYNTTLTTTGTVGVCPDRLCGNAFNPNTNQASDVPVYSFRKPFIITYHTDASEPAAADSNNRGFCLNYVQQPCLPNLG